MSERKNSLLNSQGVDQKSELHEDHKAAKETLKREYGLNKILGQSKVVKELHKKIDKISLCDANVLISGESGTGKELVARAIHYLSPRSGRPFIPVNSSAIPESLFENELFGHVKGAFTDAGFHQAGLVKEAEGGTLFLDEVGSISPMVQAKLLRLLEDKEYKPLGDPKPRKADIRIIAATNQELQSLVLKNEFREDLFYRLNIVPIYIPPLRERKDDILILVEHFLNIYSKQYNKPVPKLTKEAILAFVSYSWPGNIRELENKIQQIIVMSSSVVRADGLPVPLVEMNIKETKFENLNVAKKKVAESFEKSYLIRVLKKHRGDVIQAAKSAGKSRTGLWNLLKKYNLSPKQFRY
jgi:two-component system response regulator GlrR